MEHFWRIDSKQTQKLLCKNYNLFNIIISIIYKFVLDKDENGM